MSTKKEMDVRVSIKYTSIDVREKPTTASDKISVHDIDLDKEYKATKYIKGWYYIQEFKGWVLVVDVIKRHVYSWGDYGDGTETAPGEEEIEEIIYDPEELVKSINKASNFINSNKISIVIDNKQINLETLIKSLDNTLADMQNVVIKVGKMETIPMIDNYEEGLIPIVVGEVDDYSGKTEFSVKWTKLSFDQLGDIPRIFTDNEW